MIDRYGFFDNYFDTQEKRYKKGFMSFSLGDYLRNGNPSKFKITSNYEFRPDKIAFKFYGDASLSWVLIYANNFRNAIADFYANREILIPEMSIVNSLLQL